MEKKNVTHKIAIDRKTGRTIDLGPLAEIQKKQAARRLARTVKTPLTARQKLAVKRGHVKR